MPPGSSLGSFSEAFFFFRLPLFPCVQPPLPSMVEDTVFSLPLGFFLHCVRGHSLFPPLFFPWKNPPGQSPNCCPPLLVPAPPFGSRWVTNPGSPRFFLSSFTKSPLTQFSRRAPLAPPWSNSFFETPLPCKPGSFQYNDGCFLSFWGFFGALFLCFSFDSHSEGHIVVPHGPSAVRPSHRVTAGLTDRYVSVFCFPRFFSPFFVNPFPSPEG